MNAPASSTSSPKQAKGHPTRQTLAEWVSLAVSCLLLLSIAGYLVVEAVRSNGTLVPVRVLPQLDQVQAFAHRYYLPIRIENLGRRSIHDLKIQLIYSPPQQQRQEGEIQVNYLGEGASQDVYWIFPTDPRTLNVQAHAVQYRLE